MKRHHLVVDLPSSTFALFDPERLQHRRAEESWMKDAKQLDREVEAGALLTLPIGERRVAVEVCENDAGTDAGGDHSFEVRSGRVYAGDLSEVPSTRWGKRRWNVWDWVFLAMVLSVPPFLLWFVGVGPWVAELTGAMALVFIAFTIPFTWLVFRGKSEFARRTGLPPDDFPNQVVELPPGSYRARVEQAPQGIRILLTASASPTTPSS